MALTQEQMQAIAIAKARQRQAQSQQAESQTGQGMPQADQYPSITSDVSGFVESPDQVAGQDFTQKPGWQLPYPPGMTKEERQTAREAVVPAMAVAGAVPSGGTSLLAIGGAAVGAGLGATGGKLIEQKLEGKPLDLADAVGEGSHAAAWTAGGGLAFKALGGLASKIFSPVSDEAKQAAKYAVENKLPLPSAAQPGKAGMLGQYAEQATFPTRIASINDAKKINTYLNTQTQALTKDAKVIDEVAQNGQQFFKNVFDTAKETGEGGFTKFLDTMGRDTMTAMHKTKPAIIDLMNKMKASGNTSNQLYQRLTRIVKQGTEDLPLEELDGLRSAIGRLAPKAKIRMADKEELINAIKADYDELGAQLGVSARDLVDEAIAKYAKFSGIKKAYPYLERFSKEFGERGGTVGSKQWFGELFTERNANALNYIRKESPALYRELADTRLAQLLENSSVARTELFGKVLDGEKLLTELNQNKDTFLKIWGSDKYNVLKNFANYAKQVGETLKTKPMSGTEASMRIGGAVGGLSYAPQIYIPSESAAYLLAKGLSNPKSILFRAFMKEAKFGRGSLLGTLGSQMSESKKKPQSGNVGNLNLFGNF